MGRSVNKVTLIGTLGRDPEVRYMPNGNAVANINLATDESYNDKTTGQKVEQTEWHRLTVYGRLAEIAQQYLHKGSRAYFEGKLKTREWEKDGIKRYTTEIVVAELMLLDRPGDNMSAQTPAPAQPQVAAMPNQNAQFGGYAGPAAQPAYTAPQAPQTPPPQQPYQPATTGGYSGYAAHPSPMPAHQPAPASNSMDGGFDDDIPF